MSDKEYDQLINRLEAVVYPIIFALFGVWCVIEVVIPLGE